MQKFLNLIAHPTTWFMVSGALVSLFYPTHPGLAAVLIGLGIFRWIIEVI